MENSNIAPSFRSWGRNLYMNNFKFKEYSIKSTVVAVMKVTGVKAKT